MADLYSKVTLRPRSKLERTLEMFQDTTGVPRRADSSLTTQLVLFYLVSAEVTPSDASRIVKQLCDDPMHVSPTKLAELQSGLVAGACPEGNVPDLITALHATGQAAQGGLDETSRRDPHETKRRLTALPRMNPESIDLILLSSGAKSTIAPSAPARRVAARLGYPGATYAAMARALDAEIPEGDATDLAWRAHHLLAQHGREVCLVSRPRCDRCSVRSACSYRGEGPDPATRLTSSTATG